MLGYFCFHLWISGGIITMSQANRGMQLEKSVEELFKHYEQRGIFCLKIEVKEVNGVRVKKSPFDFIVHYDGVMYGFDAKNCQNGNIGIANFKLHQIKALTDVENQKGEGFFLVYFADIKQLEKIPVEEVIALKAKGIKAITPDVRRKTPLDFLKIL